MTISTVLAPFPEKKKQSRKAEERPPAQPSIVLVVDLQALMWASPSSLLSVLVHQELMTCGLALCAALCWCVCEAFPYGSGGGGG